MTAETQDLATTGGSYTDRLVDYAAAFRFEDLSAEVVDEIKTLVLDTLGAMLAASQPMYSSSRLVIDFVRQLGGVPECTVVGRDFKTSVDAAALANGTMGYAADLEGARAARQHVAAVLVPTVLTLGEREQADGRTLIAALVLGYEIACRVGEACRTPHSYPRAFHPSAVFGQLGAAAAAGHLLGLNQAAFSNAFGLAATTATGLITWVNDPTEDSRPFVIGVAVRGGITAAILAAAGFGGPQAIFDPGKFTIYEAFSDEMHLDRLTAGLGEEFWVLKTDGYKRYPCCGDIHSGLDSLFAILAEQDLAPEQIARLTLRVKADRAPIIDNNALRSHCAQYIFGVAAVDRRIDLATILEDRRSDPRVRAMVERVTLVGDPQLDLREAKAPGVAEVQTVDGRLFSRLTDYPRGARQNPMTRAELEEKFFWLATTVLPRSRAEKLRDTVQNLERLEDARELAELLATPAVL